MTEYDFAWARFYSASKLLNSEDEDMRALLLDAYSDYICGVFESQVPEECRASLKKINEYISLPDGVSPIGGSDGTRYGVSAMNDKQVEDCIFLVQQVFAKLDEINSV